MPSTNTPKALHEPFSWLADDVKNYPMAAFVSLTLDMCGGISTCLDLANKSELDREMHDDSPDIIPVLDRVETSRLMRLAMAASELLRDEAERKIAWINEYGAKSLAELAKGRK